MKIPSLFASIVLASAVVYMFFTIPEAEAESAPSLFVLEETPRALAADSKSSPASVRESEITFGIDNFAGRIPESVSIPLFDGKTYRARMNLSEGSEERGAGNYVWRGKLAAGNFLGDVVLTRHKGFVTGLIYSPEAVYEIVAKGNRQILVELDQSLYPECGGEIAATAGKSPATNTANLVTVPDSGDRIDVLVLYTEAVKTSLGGAAQAEALAQSAIDAVNTAYINSRIRQRVRLVHTEQTALTEANTLSDLRQHAPTQTLRNERKADMVAMLVDSASYCGVAYLMNGVGNGFEPWAYSITLRTCAVGNLTFAHELGHNMGSAHNPENASSSAYPYSFGHWVDGNFRTVMSYSSPCTNGCTRVPHFSNPAVRYNGVRTGVLDQRHNQYSIENTAATVANFRYSGSALRLANFADSGFVPRNISRQVTWTSENVGGNVRIELSRDEGSTWETVVASTPNDGSETVRINGRPTKRARLRIASVNDPFVRDSSVRNISIK